MADVLSHWDDLIENFSFSSKDFYAKVESAITAREMPHAATARVEHKEGGAFSANREYLRITRGRYSFDICAAPFGTGFFVSWWLVQKRTLKGLLYLAGFVGVLAVMSIVFFILVGSLFDWLTAVILSALALPVAVFVGIPLALWIAGRLSTRSETGIDDALLDIPYIGVLYEKLFRPETYYRTDTAFMFEHSVQNAVQEVIEQITENAGIRRVSKVERKPIMKELATGHALNA